MRGLSRAGPDPCHDLHRGPCQWSALQPHVGANDRMVGLWLL